MSNHLKWLPYIMRRLASQFLFFVPIAIVLGVGAAIAKSLLEFALGPVALRIGSFLGCFAASYLFVGFVWAIIVGIRNRDDDEPIRWQFLIFLLAVPAALAFALSSWIHSSETGQALIRFSQAIGFALLFAGVCGIACAAVTLLLEGLSQRRPNWRK